MVVDQAPLAFDEFAVLMAAVGPFEATPRLAVAVSGGADSMTLCLLADRWARARGGRVVALTVDHGLRPDSAAEARNVGAWMAALGIDHRVLPWTGPKPSAGIQAAARDARYRLLCGWCRQAGILHLLLAHHRRDQAETVLMRLRSGSGLHGLAAMAQVTETPSVRLLRPLLRVPPDRLSAHLAACGQGWIEDPSNRDPAYLRARLRRALPALAAVGIDEESLAATAARMGRARAFLEQAASTLLARCLRLHPAGYGLIDDGVMGAAPAEISLRALARVLQCVGGRDREPGTQPLERLHARLIVEKAVPSATLGGCLLVRTDRGLLMCRELRGLPEPVAVAGNERLTWDGRFDLAIDAPGGPAIGGVRLVALGPAGWKQVAGAGSDHLLRPVPRPAAQSLPALADGEGIFNVPHLGYRRAAGESAPIGFAAAAFRPRSAASGAGYFLA